MTLLSEISNTHTSSFFSFFFFLGWESDSCEGALSSLEYSRIKTSMAPLIIWSLLFVSSSKASSSSLVTVSGLAFLKKEKGQIQGGREKNQSKAKT